MFGVYSPDTGKVYLVPVKDVPSSGDVTLRLLKTKNNQEKGVRWAKAYEILRGYLLYLACLPSCKEANSMLKYNT